jgi:hypothetical protein
VAEERNIRPEIQSMGFAMAAIVIAVTTLDNSIKRGAITQAEANDTIARARKMLEEFRKGAQLPQEKEVFQTATDALQTAEAFLVMAGAEAPPAGAH